MPPGDPPHKGLHWAEKRGAGGGRGRKGVHRQDSAGPSEDLVFGYGPSAGGPLRPMPFPAASGSLLPEGLGQDSEGRGNCHRAEKTRGEHWRAEKEGEGSDAKEQLGAQQGQLTCRVQAQMFPEDGQEGRGCENGWISTSI